MAEFVGRSNNLLLFTDGVTGVVVDSEIGLIASSGPVAELALTEPWSDGGVFDEHEEGLAQAALLSLSIKAQAAQGRKYTIPRGAVTEARNALEMRGVASRRIIETSGTPVGLRTANILAAGGQIDISDLRGIARFFARHADEANSTEFNSIVDGGPSAARISWGLRGGDAARRWAAAIVGEDGNSSLTAGGFLVDVSTPDIDAFRDAFELDPEVTPEFIARVRLDGSGMDRMYKVDFDGQVYVWDDATWDNLGSVDQDIWQIDATLDNPYDVVEKTHIIIDAGSAVKMGALLALNPYSTVQVSDIDPAEAALMSQLIPDMDWGMLDMVEDVIVAAATGVDSTSSTADPIPGDGVYTPQERSKNAAAQVRDKNGKFATVGSRVMIGGNKGNVGSVTAVNKITGTVTVSLDGGSSVTVSAKSVEAINPTFDNPAAPGAAPAVPLQGNPGAQTAGPDPVTGQPAGIPVAVPTANLDGIVGKPRESATESQAVIPTTMRAMSGGSVHKLLTNWPLYVKSHGGGIKKSEHEKHLAGPDNEPEHETYKHPLLQDWHDEAKAMPPQQPDWVQSITADGAGTATSPSSSQPVYMAVVSPDDPSAVLQLIVLVPDAEGTAPMVYERENQAWVANPQVLRDLQSATPPPVVPLDSDTLTDVIQQVDASENKKGSVPSAGKSAAATANAGQNPVPAPASPTAPTSTAADAGTDASGNPADSSTTPSAAPAAAPAAGVTAAAQEMLYSDLAFTVLWGPHREEVITAGGHGNRGNAETLKRYWTVGEGGAKIRWGVKSGAWRRCVRHLSKYIGLKSKNYCALRFHEMLGIWPGDKANRSKNSLHAGGVNYDVETLLDQDMVIERAYNNARSVEIRNKFYGLTAGGGADYPPGASFTIPLIVPEGIPTGDGRIFERGTIEIRDLPLPLMWQIKTATGHDGSVVVGRIDYMERTPDGIGNARGVFDNGPYGREAQRLVENGFIRGVSADMDQFEAQQIIAIDDPEEMDSADPVVETLGGDTIIVNHSRVMAATIVPKPAFQECVILITEDEPEEVEMIPDGVYIEEDDEINPIETEVLMASAYIAANVPLAPPSSWFSNPDLTGPTPLTVTDDGQVFGHIAAWDTHHIGIARKTTPPHSASGYKYFHTGVVRTEDGKDVPVGHLTLSGGHADIQASAREAIRHYDDTNSTVADVHAGEDRYGIWVAGAVRPGTTAEQVRAFRASAPSGDWRVFKNQLELVAVCQVNVPGFPMPRAVVASGQVVALTAAGAPALLQLRHDPLADLNARLEQLETARLSELTPRIDAARAKVEAVKARRSEELAARADQLADRFSEITNFAYISKKKRDELAKSGKALPDGSYPIETVSDLHKAIQAYGRAKPEHRGDVRKHIIKRARALGKSALIPQNWLPASNGTLGIHEAPPPSARPRPKLASSALTAATPAQPSSADGENELPKYNAATQPRNDIGEFRQVLARLQSGLSDSANEEILAHIKEVNKNANIGNYKGAVQASQDLVNLLNRIDHGTISPHDHATLREASNFLSKAIADMPLPFSDQAQHLDYHELPPALKELAQELMDRINAKYGDKKGAALTKVFAQYTHGYGSFNTSQISAQFNRMLHLLTA